MKNTKWMLLVGLLVSGMAFAQSIADGRVVAKVPFDFMVANKTIPAGECVVQSGNMDGNVLLIRNFGAKASSFAPSSHDEMNKASGDTTLVFTRYGNQYFLSSIRIEGSNWSYRLPESRAEAELRAQNVTGTQQVLLASLK